MQSNHDHKTTTALAERAIELPVVIRPQPMRLQDLERRARIDVEFADALTSQPEFCALLATAVLARDADARARFGDARALAAHLGAAIRG